MVREGIAVEFTMTPVAAGDRPAGEVREGDDVLFRFQITETATGSGLAKLHPAAWVVASRPGEPKDPRATARQVASFIRGNRTAPPELDLNVYYVLALNQDATVTVVDPLFGFGGTKLLALVPLPAPGWDWALTPNQSRLFVSSPDAGRVSVIDTSTWTGSGTLDGIPRPTRVSLQPDGHYLWVVQAAAPGESAAGGVSIWDVDRLQLQKVIPMGHGPHEIAFTQDNRFACVTSRADGTASLVDIRALERVGKLPAGKGPVSVAYSPSARMFYVSNEDEGTLAVLDPERGRVVARLPAEPGLGQVRFAPGGRLGLVVNPRKDVVHIVDSAANRLVQTADMRSGPDQVTFTDELAYIRHRGSETVRMIPLAGLGAAGQPVRVVDFPGGQNPLGAVPSPSLADTIVPASGEAAVLVANPADKAIYYYKEGLAAPMGNFSNYGRQPRAVLTVDRSLREKAPGVYETVARLRAPGPHEVLFLLDNPRILHGFEVTIGKDPNSRRSAPGPRVEAALLVCDPRPAPGRKTRLEFRLAEPGAKGAIEGVQDLGVLVFHPSNWQMRQRAREPRPGVYAIDFAPPLPGTYYLYVQSASLGLSGPRTRALTLVVEETADDDRQPTGPSAAMGKSLRPPDSVAPRPPGL
jgi:hypothetical protein